jgi:hypothetical protein
MPRLAKARRPRWQAGRQTSLRLRRAVICEIELLKKPRPIKRPDRIAVARRLLAGRRECLPAEAVQGKRIPKGYWHRFRQKITIENAKTKRAPGLGARCF